jgi:hypothetical protein
MPHNKSQTNSARRYAKIDDAAEYLDVHPITIRA